MLDEYSIHKVITMTEFNLVSTTEELRCSWLKRDVSDCQQIAKSLLVTLGWLTQPMIEGLLTLAAPIQLSSFLYLVRLNEAIFFKCNRFPYEKKTINKWFTISSDELPKRVVNIINVDKNGKTDKCYTTQNGDNFLQSNGDFEVFLHGTRHESAQIIIEDGIDLTKGQRNRDLSDGDGFYLGNDFNEVWTTRWARNRPPCSAVLVFRVKRTELRGRRHGLDLQSSVDEWKELVSTFRTGRADARYKENLERYDFIEGPLCGDNQNFNNPTPNIGTYQLCVKSDTCAELFDRSLHSVIFFER